MTDNKLTDEQIIKALKNATVCVGVGAFFEKAIKGEKLKIDIYDLINRQRAEIERLQKDGLQLNKTFMDFVNKATAEARKEFAERVKKKATYYRCRDGIKYAVSISDIDNLLKEMDGDTK